MEKTNYHNPKTSGDINDEIKEIWNKLFPDEEFKDMSKAAISRHIRDMNASGLYNIKTHDDNRLGYYDSGDKKGIFNSEEAIIIAAALYRSPSISSEETQNILKKFLNLVGMLGSTYVYFLYQQTKQWKGLRKTPRNILPIVKKIYSAIYSNKKLLFKYYENSDNNTSSMNFLRDNKNRIIKYKVSPYFLIWESDECYLVANNPQEDLSKKSQLNQYKISLIGDIEILDEESLPIRKIVDYKHYKIESELYYANDEQNRGGLSIDFSLDNYMKEHIFASSSQFPLVDIKIYFMENLMEEILTRFDLRKEALTISPNGEIWNNQKVYRATITVQENEGLYQWLMQHSDKLVVKSPKQIQEKLKQRLTNALNLLDEFDEE